MHVVSTIAPVCYTIKVIYTWYGNIMDNVKNKILELKKQKNAVILAHCYQNVEIDEVADYVGDSLYLSQMAAESDADMIVFAGVTFMAETAKIISPDKKVIIPDLNSGCEMADMIDLENLRAFKAKHPEVPTVCYINSTAEVKSECDICCTSSNAVKIVESLKSDKVLFVPDQYLGKWVEAQLEGVEVITYDGCCPIHNQVTKKDIISMREKYSNSKVLTHPECRKEVAELSDYVGSTTGIMNFVKNHPEENSFIIVTEKGVIDRLKRDYPQKEFVLITKNMVCPNMKTNSLNTIYSALTEEKYEIELDKETSKKALTCINRMLEVSK